MINFRVEDLDWLLSQLRAEGVEVDAKTEESEFGKFVWAMDPLGTTSQVVRAIARIKHNDTEPTNQLCAFVSL